MKRAIFLISLFLLSISSPLAASSYTNSQFDDGTTSFEHKFSSSGDVNAGDIIIGDDDGIAVIPLEQSEELLKLSINRISMEEKIINELKNGIEHKVIFDITEV